MATVGSNLGGILIKHCTGRITSTMRAAFRMLNVATDGTQEATKFINTDANTNQGIAKATALYIGASASEVQVNATPKEINEAADVSARGLALTTTKAVEETDNNKVFFLNAVAGFTVTMPKLSEVAKGWRCKFIVKTAPSGTADYVITEDGTADTDKVHSACDSADVVSTTDSAGSATHTFINFVDGSSVAGDFCLWETDGTNWYVYGKSSVTAGITAT